MTIYTLSNCQIFRHLATTNGSHVTKDRLNPKEAGDM